MNTTEEGMRTTTIREAPVHPSRRGRKPLRRPFDDAGERLRRANDPALPTTDHAQTRMSHRGLTRWDLEAVVDYGREVWQRGSVTFVVGRREVVAARACGVDLRHVEGVHVVCAKRSMVVLTAYRNRGALHLVA
jgi:hypothetical protein